jgi:hypothetical protein
MHFVVSNLLSVSAAHCAQGPCQFEIVRIDFAQQLMRNEMLFRGQMDFVDLGFGATHAARNYVMTLEISAKDSASRTIN